MRVRVIKPSEPFVTLAEAKKHLIVESNDDNDLIEAYVAAATRSIDGPDGILGRALGLQTLEATGCFLSRRIRLPCPPVLNIVEVAAEDEQGQEEIVSPSDYRLSGDELVINVGAAWVTKPRHRILYQAGYVQPDKDDPAKFVSIVPAPIRVAIMMLVAQWYLSREQVALGATVQQMPFGAEALLSAYRIPL